MVSTKGNEVDMVAASLRYGMRELGRMLEMVEKNDTLIGQDFDKQLNKVVCTINSLRRSLQEQRTDDPWLF